MGMLAHAIILIAARHGYRAPIALARVVAQAAHDGAPVTIAAARIYTTVASQWVLAVRCDG